MSTSPEADDPFDAIVQSGLATDDWVELEELSVQVESVETANTDWISAVTDCYDGANTGTLDLEHLGALRVSTVALFKNVRSTAAFLDSVQHTTAAQELGGLIHICDKQQVRAFGELLGSPLSVTEGSAPIYEERINLGLGLVDGRRVEKVATGLFFTVSMWNLRILLDQAIAG